MTTHWVHNCDPFIFQLEEPINVLGIQFEGLRWYGFAYFLGFLVAILAMRWYYKKGLISLNPEQQSTFINYIVLGVIIGGRLGYCLFYNLPEFLSNPLWFFRFSEGGMASHGGFLGIAAGTLLFCRQQQQNFWSTSDWLVTLGPAGLFFGRIANFINGELWGKTSQVPWAIIFPQSGSYGQALSDIAPRHPSQLYEALGEGLLLGLFAWIRFRYYSHPGKIPPGQLSGEFLCFYAIARIICELFREADATLILGMQRGSFFSLALLLVGAIIIYQARKRQQAFNDTFSKRYN